MEQILLPKKKRKEKKRKGAFRGPFRGSSFYNIVAANLIFIDHISPSPQIVYGPISEAIHLYF